MGGGLRAAWVWWNLVYHFQFKKLVWYTYLTTCFPSIDPGHHLRVSRDSRLLRASFRTGAKDSEATRKSSASAFASSIGHSSKDSPIANRCISAIICASACRLVEPTRT